MERAGGQQLSKELKAKIVYLKNYTALTWEEIARECHCSVIADFIIVFVGCLRLLVFSCAVKKSFAPYIYELNSNSMRLSNPLGRRMQILVASLRGNWRRRKTPRFRPKHVSYRITTKRNCRNLHC